MTTARFEEETRTDDSAGIVQGALTRLSLIRDGSDRGKPFKRWRLASAENHLAQSAILGASESSDGVMQREEQDAVIAEGSTPDTNSGIEPVVPDAFGEDARL